MLSLPHPVQVADRIYTAVDDRTSLYHVLIYGVVRDEATGPVHDPTKRRAPRTPFDVRVDRDDVFVKTLADGYFCLAGYADRVFPDHATTPYTVNITITADGYQPTAQSISVPAAVDYPVVAATIDLRRAPVQVRGRVTSTVELNGLYPPIANARLIALDILPAPPPPPPVPHVMTLRTPLHFDRAAGGAITVQEHTLTSAALAPARQLALSARGGSWSVFVNNRQGMSANQIIQIGADFLGEYVVIDTVVPSPTPGEVILRYPLTHSFATNTPLHVFTDGGAIGSAAQFDRAAEAGDGLLLLDTALNPSVIAIIDPAQPTEYHAVGALTDADGFYQLTGVSRIETIRLRVSAAAFTTKTLEWMIDYTQAVNRVDVQLSP